MRMPGEMHIVIDGVPMEDDYKLILADLTTPEQIRDFYYVYFFFNPIRRDGGRKTYEEAYEDSQNSVIESNKNVIEEKRCDGGTVEVTKDTINDDAKLAVVVKAGKKIKSKDEEKKRRKYFRDIKKRIPCRDEGCGKTFKSKGNMEKHLGKKKTC